MEAVVLAHALVLALTAAAFAAIARSAAARKAPRDLRVGRGLMIAWWGGGAVSQAAASVGVAAAALDVGPPALYDVLLGVFLLAGCLAAIALVLHLLHVAEDEMRGGARTLGIATALAFAALGLGLWPGGTVPLLATTLGAGLPVGDALLAQGLLSATLVLYGVPLLAALGYAGLALTPLDPPARERVVLVAGGLVAWAAAKFLVAATTFLAVPGLRFAALAAAAGAALLCVLPYRAPRWLHARLASA